MCISDIMQQFSFHCRSNLKEKNEKSYINTRSDRPLQVLLCYHVNECLVDWRMTCFLHDIYKNLQQFLISSRSLAVNVVGL